VVGYAFTASRRGDANNVLSLSFLCGCGLWGNGDNLSVMLGALAGCLVILFLWRLYSVFDCTGHTPDNMFGSKWYLFLDGARCRRWILLGALRDWVIVKVLSPLNGLGKSRAWLCVATLFSARAFDHSKKLVGIDTAFPRQSP